MKRRDFPAFHPLSVLRPATQVHELLLELAQAQTSAEHPDFTPESLVWSSKMR